MRIAIASGGPAALPEWQAHFQAFDPAIEVLGWEAAQADPAGVRYALVWQPPHGGLAALPDLRLIISAGAGVDGILDDPLRPAHLPIARMITDSTPDVMAEYVLSAALMLLREGRRMALNQAERRWDILPAPRRMQDTRVGIMGLGQLGKASALLLARAGFPVSGWSRTPTELPGVRTHAGAAGFDAFLADTDILVCLLPATPATQGILGARTFERLPAGAAVINVGRGSHLDEPALLAALDAGRLSGAVLDVFETEPLPAASPLWSHPAIIVTPHYGATPSRRDRAQHAVQLIHLAERGQPLPHLYDAARGY